MPGERHLGTICGTLTLLGKVDYDHHNKRHAHTTHGIHCLLIAPSDFSRLHYNLPLSGHSIHLDRFFMHHSR